MKAPADLVPSEDLLFRDGTFYVFLHGRTSSFWPHLQGIFLFLRAPLS
jgi:hypothetical protein